MDWMVWTLPTALFFSTIALILISMTVWEVVQPSTFRRGLLPLKTTRGDRLFIGLLTSAWFHLGWLGLTDQPVWYMTIFCVFWLVALMRWG